MSDEVVNPTPEEEVAPVASFNEWLGDVTGEQVDPEDDAADDSVITIATTAGGHYDVPVEAGEILTVQEVLTRSNLLTTGAIEFWVYGVKVAPTYQVAPGARVSVVGVVKGG